MKKNNLLVFAFFVIILQSCQKQEVIQKPQQSFTPPETEKAILESIELFKGNIEKFNNGQLTRNEELYSSDEAVWLLEATANYDFADMSQPLDSLFEDSIVISLPITSYNESNEPQVNYSDMIQIYNELYTQTDSIIGNQRTSVMGVLMVDVEDQKKREGYIDMLVKIVRANVNPHYEPEEFQPLDCFYAWGPGSIEAANNAAKKLEKKLKIRYQVGSVANAFYTSIATHGVITVNTSYYIPINCPNTPGVLMYWGSPQVDALWQGNSGGTYLCYNELTNYKTKIQTYMDYVLSNDPVRDAISFIEFQALNIGTNPSDINVCNVVEQYSHAFQFKSAKLVINPNFPN